MSEGDQRFLARLPRWGAAGACLFGLSGVLWAAVPVQDVIHAADVAREKDVVWLALVTAIAAILFSAWLVGKSFALWKSAIDELRLLREEMQRRPCVLREGPHPLG